MKYIPLENLKPQLSTVIEKFLTYSMISVNDMNVYIASSKLASKAIYAGFSTYYSARTFLHSTGDTPLELSEK